MKLINIPHEKQGLHLGTHLIPSEPRLKGKSILQVGARPGRGWTTLFKCFKKHKYEIFHILEIYKPNVNALPKNRFWKTFPHVSLIVHGDIRKIDTYKDLLPLYDIVCFWHGIEHITKKDAIKAMPKIMAKCKKAFITGCPWGTWQQEAIGGNKHEKHVYSWYPKEFKEMGCDICVTTNNLTRGPGPNKQSGMYGVWFKDIWEQKSKNLPIFKKENT
ncbi:MAG: hypothetical protein ACXADW_02920 [Candidatus Hodarchaeales archaeon]|jgi:hypothetical protein